MSLPIRIWVSKQKLGHASAKLVLLILAGYADDAGYCACSLKELARGTGLALRTVQRKLRWLEEAGLIRRRRGETARGKNPSPALRLHVSICAAAAKKQPVGPRVMTEPER
jgi:predicted transcriptional regulator